MNPETSPKLDLRKCLTLYQPWAWLIVNGHKDVENRTWGTRYRGRLFIHAGGKFDDDGYAKVKEHFPHLQLPAPAEFKRSGIVGAVTLKDIVTDSPSPWAIDGCQHWICTDPEVLPFEPCRGSQQIWTAGEKRRVMELPAGFTIKSGRQSSLDEDEDTAVTQYRATLYRDGVSVWQSPALNTGAHARDLAMREAHRLNALPTPPEALTNEPCTCHE